jgi:hypothetical protein
MIGGRAAQQRLHGAAELEGRSLPVVGGSRRDGAHLTGVAGGGDPVGGRWLGRAGAGRLGDAQCCFSCVGTQATTGGGGRACG